MFKIHSYYNNNINFFLAKNTNKKNSSDKDNRNELLDCDSIKYEVLCIPIIFYKNIF